MLSTLPFRRRLAYNGWIRSAAGIGRGAVAGRFTLASSDDHPNDPKPDNAAPTRGGQRPQLPRTWMATHGRDLRFLVIFGILMGVYYWATTTSVVTDRFFPWYLTVTTQVSGKTLQAMGYDDMQIKGNALDGPQRTVTIERGCDAIAPTALFLSAVIASPVLWGSKLFAVLAGTAVLMFLNVLRIVTLYMTAVHWPAAFDMMHLDVWQAAFIFFALLMWALWASTLSRRQGQKSHATT